MSDFSFVRFQSMINVAAPNCSLKHFLLFKKVICIFSKQNSDLFSVTDNKINSVNNAQYNGKCAAEHFCKAERASVNGDPFIWFFVRPPWAPIGVCCKSCVFNNMVEFCTVSEVRHQL